MSKSTPISQLPQPNQAGMMMAGELPDDDATIQSVTREIRQQPMMAYPQPQMQQAPSGRPDVTPDAKLAIIVVIVALLLFNNTVADMVAEKVPGMSNPWLSLAVRAAIAAVLIVAVNRFI